MKATTIIKQKPITNTNTESTAWTIELTGEGSYREVKWLEEKLAEIFKAT